MKKILLCVLTVAGLSGMVRADSVERLDAVIANETGLSYNTTFFLDISQAQNFSMQVNYTSASFSVATFNDGVQSTGNLTVVSYAALSSATATASFNIDNDTGTSNATVYVGGVNLYNPAQWQTDLVFTSNTVCSLAQAINTYTVFKSSCNTPSAYGYSLIIASAPTYGTYYNQFSIGSSTYSAVAPGISSAAFSGGQDPATLTINGTRLTANVDFYPITSNAVTAKAIAAAINANSTLNQIVVATCPSAGTGAIVYTTSTAAGTFANYTVISSTNGALKLSPPSSVDSAGNVGTGTMFGGANSALALNSGIINIPSHGFTTALQVQLTTVTANTTAIGGIPGGTSYYIQVVDSNNVRLSTSIPDAVTGTVFKTVTSSAPSTTTHSWTLTAVTIAGTPSFKWQVSNDNTFWNDLTTTLNNVAVSGVSMGSYVFGSTSTIWDVGSLDHKAIRLNVTAPTAGGIQLKAFVHGKAP